MFKHRYELRSKIKRLMAVMASYGVVPCAMQILLSAALDAQPAPGSIPAAFFGMHLTTKTNWPTVPIGTLGKGTFTNWPYIERTQGVRDWSNLDAWVDAA